MRAKIHSNQHAYGTETHEQDLPLGKKPRVIVIIWTCRSYDGTGTENHGNTKADKQDSQEQELKIRCSSSRRIHRNTLCKQLLKLAQFLLDFMHDRFWNLYVIVQSMRERCTPYVHIFNCQNGVRRFQLA